MGRSHVPDPQCSGGVGPRRCARRTPRQGCRALGGQTPRRPHASLLTELPRQPSAHRRRQPPSTAPRQPTSRSLAQRGGCEEVHSGPQPERTTGSVTPSGSSVRLERSSWCSVRSSPGTTSLPISTVTLHSGRCCKLTSTSSPPPTSSARARFMDSLSRVRPTHGPPLIEVGAAGLAIVGAGDLAVTRRIPPFGRAARSFARSFDCVHNDPQIGACSTNPGELDALSRCHPSQELGSGSSALS